MWWNSSLFYCVLIMTIPVHSEPRTRCCFEHFLDKYCRAPVALKKVEGSRKVAVSIWTVKSHVEYAPYTALDTLDSWLDLTSAHVLVVSVKCLRYVLVYVRTVQLPHAFTRQRAYVVDGSIVQNWEDVLFTINEAWSRSLKPRQSERGFVDGFWGGGE